MGTPSAVCFCTHIWSFGLVAHVQPYQELDRLNCLGTYPTPPRGADRSGSGPNFVFLSTGHPTSSHPCNFFLSQRRVLPTALTCSHSFGNFSRTPPSPGPIRRREFLPLIHFLLTLANDKHHDITRHRDTRHPFSSFLPLSFGLVASLPSVLAEQVRDGPAPHSLPLHTQKLSGGFCVVRRWCLYHKH